MGNTSLSYLFIGIASMCFVACSEIKEEATYIQYEDLHEVMDTIVAKRSYTSLSAKEIIPSIKKNLKGKVVLVLPTFEETDATKEDDYIQALAVSSIYATWAQELNQPKLKDSALTRAAYLLEKIELTEQSEQLENSKNADSLANSLSDYLNEDSLSMKDAYFEAVSWLENLAITLKLDKNVRNKSDYKALILQQLVKGDELLEYLYDYQDYEPVSLISLGMLEILDCKNYELNVTQLKELVMDLRSNPDFALLNNP